MPGVKQAIVSTIFLLRTGLTPSASGSAYLEFERLPARTPVTLSNRPSSLKLSCTVHGPKPLPRNASFSPQLLLSAHVKCAPFALTSRRGFLRDGSELDLSSHLETALKAVILGDRWPKSSVEVVVTVLEGETDERHGIGGASQSTNAWGDMRVLAGCITAANAALVQAGVDCIDLVSGGTAAIIPSINNTGFEIAQYPRPSGNSAPVALCCVGHLSSRDEIVELWQKGVVPGDLEESLLDGAVAAAQTSHAVLAEVLRESTLSQAVEPKKAMHAKAAHSGSG
ncbi:MAG: hypothetical protein Q9159_004508 [Coniocarpon cinnabarinum]